MTGPAHQDTGSAEVRRLRERRGRSSETIAALALIARGHRILARRWSCHAGEVDIVAVRGRRLSFVEVKRRRDTTDEEAHQALGPRQRSRVREAAAVWLQRNPCYRDRDITFDLVLVAPWRWPRHIPGGL